MEKELGYSQMRFNSMTAYANTINEKVIRMEMAWQNRKSFSDEVNVGDWLSGQKAELDDLIESFKQYIEPVEEWI